MSQNLGRGARIVARRKRLGNRQVKDMPALAQQALIGDILDQRMLEGINLALFVTAAKDQLRVEQAVERGI